MITVYHLENSRSERVIWLMEELGLPYDLKRFQREPTMQAPEAMRAISPMGKAPMIRDGDTVILESGAILEYIANTAGGGRLAVKPGAKNYAAYLQWMHFSEGSAMPSFILNLFVGGFFPGVDPNSPLVGMARQSSVKVLSFIDGELAKTPYFAGNEFTAADIMMAYCFGIVRSPVMSIDMAQYPNLAAYIARIEARPAYQKAMAIANPGQ
jgi:glutathione S-transferase